jgi:hypothetical protein
MVKLSYHSPQFPPINRRDAKANVSEFSVLCFSVLVLPTEKCRTEKYGPMISQIFGEPFHAGFLHEGMRAAGELSPARLISEPENLQKENFERMVIWRKVRQLHLLEYRSQLAKSVPKEASALTLFCASGAR